VSDDWLQLIPADPGHVPDAAAAEMARSMLAAIVGEAEAVTVTVTEDVNFIDAGANLERIGCPACESEIDAAWWVRRIDRASDTAFAELEVRVPCCGARLSLNDLAYDRPAGFARFVLEARNPDVTELTAVQLADLSRTLGTPLRVVWTHI
jgi:hypothetical protein